MNSSTEIDTPPNPSSSLDAGSQGNLSSSAPDVSHLFKVYKAPETSGTNPLSGLTDSDFEPTTAELQAAYASQKQKFEILVNAPFKTQAIKEKEQKGRMNRWPTTTIRIKFSNQTILERSFASSEKIKVVYQFVRSALIAEALGDKFVLYLPPRTELKVSDPQVKPLSLGELGLSPSSVLFIKFQTEAYNSSALPPPLLPQILEQAIPLPDAVVPKKPVSSTTGSSSSKPSTGATGKKKVPKWFKIGQKE